MYDVFISYNRRDSEHAEKVFELLSNRGLKVFIDRNELPKISISDYSVAIEEVIDGCKNMIVVGTSAKNITSNWVEAEWRMFINSKRSSRDGKFRNIITAVVSVNPLELPLSLRMYEVVSLDDPEKICIYMKDNSAKLHERYEKRINKMLHETLVAANWEDSILASPEALADYEKSITSSLSAVTIVSDTVMHDSPGGALFETTAENLFKGIRYRYVLFRNPERRALLRALHNGHTESNRKNLTLQYVDGDSWLWGYSLITFYEFKDKRDMQGYIRVKIAVGNFGESRCIYVRMPKEHTNMFYSKLLDLEDEGSIKTYQGGGGS